MTTPIPVRARRLRLGLSSSLTVRLSPTMRDAVDELADATGLTSGDIARIALDDYLTASTKTKPRLRMKSAA